MYTALGLLAFPIMIAGDFLELKGRSAAGRVCFFPGLTLLLSAVAALCATGFPGPLPPLPAALFGALGFLFLFLLIFTLFFAFSFGEVYLGKGGKPEVYDRGVYALCRHPGILWFAGLCVCLCGALGMPPHAALLFSAANLGYAAIQDALVFEETLSGYGEYKKRVPFLIPGKKEIKNCFEFYFDRKGGGH